MTETHPRVSICSKEAPILFFLIQRNEDASFLYLQTNFVNEEKTMQTTRLQNQHMNCLSLLLISLGLLRSNFALITDLERSNHTLIAQSEENNYAWIRQPRCRNGGWIELFINAVKSGNCLRKSKDSSFFIGFWRERRVQFPQVLLCFVRQIGYAAALSRRRCSVRIRHEVFPGRENNIILLNQGSGSWRFTWSRRSFM